MVPLKTVLVARRRNQRRRIQCLKQLIQFLVSENAIIKNTIRNQPVTVSRTERRVANIRESVHSTGHPNRILAQPPTHLCIVPPVQVVLQVGILVERPASEGEE
jgi:hypothetical protein